MNYRRNEDKLCFDESGSAYNVIHSIEDISASSPSDEPVTLQEVKDYLRLEGWQSDDDSPGDDFDFDDALVSSMITEGRMYVEKITGIAVIPKTLQVVLSNGAGLQAIPGPVTGSIAVTDIENQTVTDAAYIGTDFPKMREPRYNMMTLTYPAGYTVAPAWVKNAIKAYVAWAYEHRGDEENLKGSPERCAAICRPHRRVKAWA